MIWPFVLVSLAGEMRSDYVTAEDQFIRVLGGGPSFEFLGRLCLSPKDQSPHLLRVLAPAPLSECTAKGLVGCYRKLPPLSDAELTGLVTLLEGEEPPSKYLKYLQVRRLELRRKMRLYLQSRFGAPRWPWSLNASGKLVLAQPKPSDANSVVGPHELSQLLSHLLRESLLARTRKLEFQDPPEASLSLRPINAMDPSSVLERVNSLPSYEFLSAMTEKPDGNIDYLCMVMPRPLSECNVQNVYQIVRSLMSVPDTTLAKVVELICPHAHAVQPSAQVFREKVEEQKRRISLVLLALYIDRHAPKATAKGWLPDYPWRISPDGTLSLAPSPDGTPRMNQGHYEPNLVLQWLSELGLERRIPLLFESSP